MVRVAKYGFSIRISLLEYKGNFSTRGQKKKEMRKQRQDTVKQGKGLTLKSSGELTKLRDHYFKRQNEKICSSLLKKKPG